MSVQDPFTVYRSALALGARDPARSRALFERAIDLWALSMGDPNFSLQIARRVERIPDPGAAANVVADLVVRQLPEWIVAVHFEIVSAELNSARLDVLQMHWRLLEQMSRSGAFERAARLRDLREILCQRRLGVDLVAASFGERRDCLRNAERLLRVDPGNSMARSIAVSAYTLELDAAREAAGARRRVGGRSNVRRGRALLMTRDARKLRRHLRLAGAGTERVESEVVQGYAALCIYHADAGERDTALRVLRRARGLSRQYPELRELRKRIRSRRRRA